MAQHSDRNLMKASNLGVVFGPTLMRPERESVATIVDIKYQNIVVEEMIEQMDKVSSRSSILREYVYSLLADHAYWWGWSPKCPKKGFCVI